MSPTDRTIHPSDECGRCHHRRFEHCHDGCAMRQMYGPRYPCGCSAFEPQRVLCAHADQNGEGAHWLEEGETCPLSPERERGMSTNG